MKQKKIPLRTCVVSGEQFPKRDLLRIVKTKEGEIKVDETGKMNGRGAYIKKDLGILEQAKKKIVWVENWSVRFQILSMRRLKRF